MLLKLVKFKGCVQSYGNYSQLTSSGVDPTELFDDIRDNTKPVKDAIFKVQDITKPEQINNHHLLPEEKEKKHFHFGRSQSNPGSSRVEEISLHAASSVYSITSICDEIKEQETEVHPDWYDHGNECFCTFRVWQLVGKLEI